MKKIVIKLFISNLIYILFFIDISEAQNTTPDVFYIPGSTQKIEQLIGDFDKHLQKNTQSRTQTKYELKSTDLGSPFKHKDKTYLLFGDVWISNGDPIAYTTDTTPEDGLFLSFITKSNGYYKPISVPGISQEGFEVPMEGISILDKMYIYLTTDYDRKNLMKRSVVARSDDDGNNFNYLYDFSTASFINVSIIKEDVEHWPGLPLSDGNGLIIFGSGRYRQSNVKLAFQMEENIENPDSILYFAGLDITKKPSWSNKESSAVPLFEQPCVGEFSVTYNSYLKKWLMLYNCDIPRGINFRTSDFPWGPWSDPQILFDPWTEGGYCNFMHVDWKYALCDSVHDDKRPNEWGGEYGPYQFDELAIGDDTSTTIYYTMSTWNPYTVVLMKSKLKRRFSTEVKNINPQNSITKCYPNPVDNELTIEFNDNFSLKTISIFNLIEEKNHYQTHSNKLTINTKGWIPGMYIITIIRDKGYSVNDKMKSLLIIKQ